MKRVSLDEPPKLAPPGAGLPKSELVVARLIFRWERWRTSRERAAANFSDQRNAILKLARGCEPASATRRVLIRRLPGLEDSSRNWSVCMTLDHLRIVNDAVAGSIHALVAGHVPLQAASTAAVKPSPDVGITAIPAFEESSLKFEKGVAATPDLATRVKYAHPWFGPLDAAGWHFMAGFHMRLHRRQIELILAGR